MKVMIVEDDALAALSVETVLRFCGHQVVGPFASTAEVMRADHGGRIDLVLMDINLEGQSSGLDCARVLHKRYGLPVVFISSDGERARSGRDVALGSMTKPISETTMMTGIKAIEQMLRGKTPAHLPAGLEVFH
ncbi:response regulator [Azospirillum canadense]|uniref:response regulator n=1 Tax=Azospirillum canadense TaxID=403962 RepID=UPI002225C9FC|nr:response regulator [Azospirillum canadense]MCW2237928.1 DNA-binding LytR/AlgR family response regulator [Azospirillum canadense]